MRIAEKLASSIGKGLVAGLAGTAAMTLSSTVEARLRHRAPSSAPARAATKALGITSFDNDIAQALPALDIAPPAIFWAPREIAIDAFHHTVYAIATGIAYELLSNARGARTSIKGATR